MHPLCVGHTVGGVEGDEDIEPHEDGADGRLCGTEHGQCII